MNSVELGWNFGINGIAGALSYQRTANKYVVQGNSITANILFTNIDKASYSRELAASLVASGVYDGQKISWVDAACERSVQDVASAVAASSDEPDTYKTYAASLKAAA
jgi:hypothetical protein